MIRCDFLTYEIKHRGEVCDLSFENSDCGVFDGEP